MRDFVCQGFTEGGGIFERGGRWYVMAGHGCCFCDLGSNGYVWSTADPLRGPWEFQGDVIARQGNQSVTKAQQFSVSGLLLGNGTVAPMFTGVRFGSAPDGNKQHDYQFWEAIAFGPSGEVLPLRWVDSWDVALKSDDYHGERKTTMLHRATLLAVLAAQARAQDQCGCMPGSGWTVTTGRGCCAQRRPRVRTTFCGPTNRRPPPRAPPSLRSG